MTTALRISDENWIRLNRLKRPAESFDDVITRLLEDSDIEQPVIEA